MTTNIDLKSRGWRLRKATEGEGEGWLEENIDGTKTRVYENPGEARREALRIEEERETGSQPAAEPKQVEEATADAPAAEASDEDSGQEDTDEGPPGRMSGKTFRVTDRGPSDWRGKVGVCVMRDGKRLTLEFEPEVTHTFTFDVLEEISTDADVPAVEAQFSEDSYSAVIISDLAGITHISHFQNLVSNHKLELLVEHKHDPRFTPQENVNIIAALDAAAEGLGMKWGASAEAEPSDEVAEGDAQSLAAVIIGELNDVDTSEELRGVEVARELDSMLRGRPDTRFNPEEREAILAAFYEAEDRTGNTQVSSAHDVAAGGGLFKEVEPAPLIQQMLPSLMDATPARMVRPEGLDPEQVEKLRAVIRSGKRLPPVDIFVDPVADKNWVADGGHRQEAALLEGDAPLDIHVHEGMFDDALRHALGSNTKHGVPRSHAGSRMAIILALLNKEWSDPKHSNTEIAKMTDTSQPFVGQVIGWLLAMLPLILEDVDGERSDEEFDAAVSGAPKGLAALVRGLPRGRVDVEQLSHNVMARAEARPAPKKAAAPEPDLFTAGEPAAEPTAEQQSDATTPDALLRLLDVLKARGAKGATVEELKELEFAEPEALEEVIQRGKVRRKVERLENGRCYYLWSPAEVADLVESRGSVSQRSLEEEGCQDYVIRTAEQDGLIKREGDDFVVGPRHSSAREERPQPQPDQRDGSRGADEEVREKVVVNDHRRFADALEGSASPSSAAAMPLARESAQAEQPSAPAPAQPRQESAPPPRPKRPTIPELLKQFGQKKLSVGLVWIAGVDGVNVTLNTTMDPQKADRRLLSYDELGELPDGLFEQIQGHVGAGVQEKPATKPAQQPWAGHSDGPGTCNNCSKRIKEGRTHTHTAKGKCAEYVLPVPDAAKGGPKKGTTDAKVARVITAIESANNLGQLSTAEKHHKLDNLSRFSEQDATAIKKALAARRKALGASPSKKAASKSASKKASSPSSKKGSSKGSGAKK